MVEIRVDLGEVLGTVFSKEVVVQHLLLTPCYLFISLGGVVVCLV